MSKFAVILVHSTGHAVQVQRVLKKAGLETKLIPTPRHLSSDCGSAVRIPAADRTRAKKLIVEAGVELDRIEVLED
jgi:hypothetical protein